ncbi:hypothetical protein ACFWFU_26075 [Streptomyces sp. NPDC060235]|uniref:hypothetical protein n=1 Tax=Streptomyces sp. NPDC060235 TaxID=3347080 RepID=UPI0036681837
MSDNDRHRQRAAADLLRVWTGDVYDEGREGSEGSSTGYLPLVWTMDAMGHLHGELPPFEGLSIVERVKQLTVWADYLGIDLRPTADGAEGVRQFTPEGACGVTVRVSVATAG